MTERRPHVVIVGAGFGGLACAKKLRRSPAHITLVDRNNYHTFQPLLYQVATAEVGSEDIAHPVRGILRRQRNLTFRMASVEGVDWAARRVIVDDGPPLDFDHLVIAAGVATAHDVAREASRGSAFGLKTLDDAVALRSHVLRQFERAAVDPAHIDRGGLTVVIAGGGPTGIELAGAFTELFSRVLAKDFPDLPAGRVVLIEERDHLLAPFHPALRDYTRRKLERRGVEVRLGEKVVDATPDVRLATGEVIPTRTLVWATGVRGVALAERLGVDLEPTGRVLVDETLRIPDHPEAFVIGDLAASSWRDGRYHPLVAQAAIQGGEHAAAEIARKLRGQPPEAFRYRDRGIMATLGRHAAVAELPIGLRFRGVPAWLAWLLLHLVYLVGFRNRIHVIINWVWAYLTGDLSARLIVDDLPAADDTEPARATRTGDDERGAAEARDRSVRALEHGEALTR